jgi:N-acetylmuramoyl-L-alanine amidase
MKKLFFLLILLILIATATSLFAYLIKGAEGEIETQDIKINSKDYILLVDVCKANGIDWEWDSISRKIYLRKDGREVVLLIGSKYYYYDDKTKRLSAPVLIKNGNIYIPLRYAKYKMKPLFNLGGKSPRIITTRTTSERRTKKTESSLERKYRIEKVVIDPGHGGKDPGAVSKTRLYEKNVVLNVSRRIKKELEKRGIDVIMTRDSDRFIPLSQRMHIANKSAADLFISIHANANRASWLRGFEVYYLSEATDDNARASAASENSVLKYEQDSLAKHTKDLDAIIWDLQFTEDREESIELAGFIRQEVRKSVRPKRNKIKSARFYVLKGAEMPAVLIELGYLSNRQDEKNLKKSSYRKKLAEGIAAGIENYKYEYEKENGFSR